MKETEFKKVTVVVVDDNTDLREALEQLISFSSSCTLLGSCESCEEASERIPILRPNVVLMDVNLGGLDGISCVRNLKKDFSEIQFLMCTVSEEDDKIFEALRAGATGYILKKTPPHKLIESILELASGGAPMSAEIARKVVHAFKDPPIANNDHPELLTLTTRENEILAWLAKGMVYKEIADNLFISPETVRKHVYHIYEKLQVKNRIEAVNKFFGRRSKN